MLHRQHVFGDQFACVFADDGHAEDAVAPGYREHLDEAVRHLVGDRAIKVIEFVDRHFVRNVARLRVDLVQADPCHFGFGEGGPRDDRVVHGKAPEAAEQGIDRGIPGLVRRGVRELERAGHVAAGEDVGVERFQVVVGIDRPVGAQRDAQLFQTVAADVGRASDGAQQGVEFDAHFTLRAFGVQHFRIAFPRKAHRLVAGQHAHAFFRETCFDPRRHIRVFPPHQARRHFDLGHVGAEAREGLRQFAADRAATEHQQTAGQGAQRPQCVRGEQIHRLDAGYRRHEGAGAGGDDDVARGQRARAAVVLGHLDRPRRGDARPRVEAIDTERGVAVHRIMRFDGAHHARDALHHIGEIELRARLAHAERLRMRDLRQQPRRADQRLRRHAAGVQAVAAHAVLLDQRHLRLHCGTDVGGDQTGTAAADHQQVVIEVRRFRPAAEHGAAAHRIDHLAGDQREHAQQHERTDQPGRQDAGQRFDAPDLGARIHEHDGAGQHAELAHPVEGACRQRGQRHRQIDREERERRHQAQREQIEGTVLLDPAVDRLERRAEARLHPVAQQEARDQEGEQGAQAGREGHDDQRLDETEQGAAGQRHDRRTGQRQRRHDDVDREEHRGRPPGRGIDLFGQHALLRLEPGQIEEAAEIENEEGGHQRHDHPEQGKLARVHGAASSSVHPGPWSIRSR